MNTLDPNIPSAEWPPVSEPKSPFTPMHKITAAAALLFGAGAFLPWMTAIVPFFGTISLNGIGPIGAGASDGWFAVGLGIALLIALMCRSKNACIVLSLLALGMTLAELAWIHHVILDSKDDSQGITVVASIGSGLWLMLAASIGAVIASFRQ